MDAMAQGPVGNKERLRLWIRLLRVARIVEGELRERLKTNFDTTLPRFDVMSALNRQPEGMLMSDLSRFLLVSNGNVTGIIERLVSDGSVLRVPVAGDKRAMLVRLTQRGRDEFARMAAAHELWINEIFGSLPLDVTAGLLATLDTIEHAQGLHSEGEHDA